MDANLGFKHNNIFGEPRALEEQNSRMMPPLGRISRRDALVGLAAQIFWAHPAYAQEKWRTLPAPPPFPPGIKSGFAEVGDIQMHYAVFGHGTPILLIHNGLGSSDDWGDVVPLLSSSHQVIVADTRGFGRSTRGTEPLSYHLFASDYLGLLDQLQIPRVALVGTSDGAIIGLDIAVHHPERLSVLFLQGVNADPSGIQRPPLDFAAIKIALMRARDQYARLSPTPTEYDSFHHSLDKMAERDPNFTAADLRSIRVPTAVAMGDHEESIRWDHTAYIATTIPGAQQIRLPGVGHFAPLQDPGGFAQAVLQFVDKG